MYSSLTKHETSWLINVLLTGNGYIINLFPKNARYYFPVRGARFLGFTEYLLSVSFDLRAIHYMYSFFKYIPITVCILHQNTVK